MSRAPCVKSYSQPVGTMSGMGPLEFRHLAADEGGNVLKMYVKKLHDSSEFDTLHTPPDELRRLVGIDKHTHIGISKMPNYIVVWKPATYGEYDAPIVIAIAHSEDINNGAIDPSKAVSVHRLRYRDHDTTLRMIGNEDEDDVRALQNTDVLPRDMLVTPSMPYDAVMKELGQRIENNDLMGAKAREAVRRTGSSGACGRRSPPNAMMSCHAGDMQSMSDSGSDAESMSSIDDLDVGTTSAWAGPEAGFDCDDGSDRSSPVSFTSTEFMSDESDCEEM